jgi:hypothetical protein
MTSVDFPFAPLLFKFCKLVRKLGETYNFKDYLLVIGSVRCLENAAKAASTQLRIYYKAVLDDIRYLVGLAFELKRNVLF